MSELLVDKYLDELVKKNGSDMYLTIGHPPVVRMQDDQIVPIAKNGLRPIDIDHFIQELMTKDNIAEFKEKMELNIAFTRGSKQRFRFNFFRQQQQNGIVIRRISCNIPTIEELRLPEIYAKAIMRKRGLIILASPGGSGKSTSMAAMIGHRNRNMSGHVVTIEDPIEFVHEHQKCIITQREVGIDTVSYNNALKNALRQRADVIAIGEIRDRHAMEHAIRFAETGHLCIATLHSNNASQAIDRMINLFPDDTRTYVLSTLAQNLIAIFSQRLVNGLKKERELAADILLNEGLIKNHIIKGEINDIKDSQERFYNLGMRTFDQSLYDLFTSHKISLETAIDESDNPSALKLRINQTGAATVEMMNSLNNRSMSGYSNSKSNDLD
ncbi:MAG: PilT/PilU family type 4a pilus ATPase [Rickettsiales bacterium]|nr:PilT/PilU family type 4a pilus ATPase [Pseudomonadota bacterium]MDA0967189.1 PilT/PilU family type 4a pilus ATPase [Pseudomonadota bacterium]MDG4544151.1 PilT/PilU family type 4a pilus ATPase [Rickettsiales bacterium]MDG4546332.1 PilT/PilU family type 4a pilus ATPase [Rickettsiales bacterium]MDG4548475.1 PilT/PilU family type 4a pilus ATPase [Rickettsiales bacterium]